MEIKPTPTDAEAVAIATAVMMATTGPVPAMKPEPVSATWRLSRRWWHRGHRLNRLGRH